MFILQSSVAQSSIDQDSGVVGSDAGVWTAVTSLTKQRVRLNMKLLGQFGSQPGTPTIKEDKPTYREQFVPPDMSMVSYFLNKVINFFKSIICFLLNVVEFFFSIAVL